MLFLRNFRTCALFRVTGTYTTQLRPVSRKMKRAYVHYENGSDTFELSLSVQDMSLGLNRQFNFKRQVTENVNSFLGRINTNLEKIYEKKKKRKQKKSPENAETNEVADVISTDLLTSDGTSVPRDIMCKDVLFDKPVILMICGTQYEIELNAPKIDVLSLPSSIMAGFPAYPNKLEGVFFDRDDSQFYWYRSKEGPNQEWKEITKCFHFTPTTDDIGWHVKLKCIPGMRERQGLPFEVTAKHPVQAGPGQCPFETRHMFTGERLSWPRFRVVSYNILADLYADSETARNQLYPYCPAYALGIDYRKQLISKEIIGYNADIACLQEVDQKVFLNDLDPVLSYLGYESVFSKKGGQVTEGLACFFHSSKFRLVSSHMVCLAEELSENPIYMDLWEKLKDNTNLVTRFKDRTTCLLVTVLQSKPSGDNENSEIFIVGNTHLYFHPDADHIRLLQGGMIMLYLEHLRTNLKSSMPNSRISLIMCGDFNSTPDCGVYQLMTTKWVPDDYKDWSSNAAEAIQKVALSHTFLLESACGTPVFTNYTVGFTGCLDYIFYQCDNLSVCQVVPFPLEEEVKEHTALPSVVFPSDHIALVCDLQVQGS